MNEPLEMEVVEIEDRIRPNAPAPKAANDEAAAGSWGARWMKLVRGVTIGVWVMKILWNVARAILRAKRAPH